MSERKEQEPTREEKIAYIKDAMERLSITLEDISITAIRKPDSDDVIDILYGCLQTIEEIQQKEQSNLPEPDRS